MGVILTYFNIFLNTSVMLAYTPFVLRYLGQGEYGLYSLAMSILTYIALLDFGFGNAIVVFTSKYLVKNEKEKQVKLYSTVLSCYFVISLISVFLMVLFYYNIELFFAMSMTVSEIEVFKQMVIIIAINIALSVPGNMFRSILSAYEKFIFLNSVNIARTLSIPLLIALSIYFGHSVITMITIVTIVNLTSIFILSIYYFLNIKVQIKLFNFDLNVFFKAFKFSIFVFIATIVDQVNWNFGQLIIGSYLGTKEIAVYSIAILFSTTFIMLSSAVSRVLLPKISKMVTAGASNAELTDEMIKIGRLQAYIIFLVLFGFAIFGDVFINFWAGKDYSDSYKLTLIIMVPLSIPLIQNLGLTILKARNKFHFRAIAALIMSILTIILSLMLTDKYGYWGVAISISITFTILNGIIMNVYYWYIGIDILSFWKQIWKVFFPMLCIFTIFYGIVEIVEIDNLLELVLGGLIFVALIFISSYLFSMNNYERGIIKRLT
ncbi:oligosaccharide flippase family protein [Vibrio crassostreae]|uniref:oligosaccharide flippase family protein n=1 Tax=Vibrio crassostreae TaxID=246167 RepID=UPI001A9FC144|nr:oligosaccharide flippase family protein [Vibrio crassostreae]